MKQRCAVKRAVRSSPQLVGSQVHAGLENFSPGKRKLCGKETCGFCTQIKEQIEDKSGTFKTRLASEDATNLFFPLDKPSRDNPIHLFSWAKKKFGEDKKVLQCGHHLSCKCCCFSHVCCFAFPPSLCLRAKYLPPGQTPPFRYHNFVNCFIYIWFLYNDILTYHIDI